jgi:predicted negative regulator of RcsB-dependent stress response
MTRAELNLILSKPLYRECNAARAYLHRVEHEYDKLEASGGDLRAAQVKKDKAFTRYDEAVKALVTLLQITPEDLPELGFDV